MGIPGNVLCDRVASLMHIYTLNWQVRPFGANALLASYTEDGPQLYSIDTSGVSARFFATAMGKGKNGAKSQLEKLNLDTMTCREAVMEVEISWICDATDKMHMLVPAAIKEEAETAAKA